MSNNANNNTGGGGLQQPLSLSHLLIQLLLESTQDEIINSTRYITSIVTSAAAFDGNKHIADEVLKTLAQNCFAQGQSVAQVSATLTNTININSRQLAKVFERIANLVLTPLTNGSQLPAITAGLNLLQLFIAHCDYPLLQVSATYLHQTLFAFLKAQYQTQPTQSNLPTSNYLRGLKLLVLLYTRSSTPGWTGLLQTLPSVRTTLDALLFTAFRSLQVPQDAIDKLDTDQFPEIQAIMPAPIATLTPGSFAVVEYVLQLLLSLLNNNATLQMCKTHIPQIHALVMLLVDLDIHSTTHLSTQPRMSPTLEQTRPTKLRAGNTNRLLPLMSQVFALSCYSGKFNDVRQTLAVRINNKKNDSAASSLLLPFPAELFLHGLAPQSLHNQKMKSDANPTAVAKRAKSAFDVDEFLNTNKADEDGNGILIDTTKAAANAITGGKGDLTLQGGVVSKDIHQRKFQGSAHLLALKVGEDDKIASEFLTDEVQTTQQGIYNKQQQMLHLDLKRCVATMLITTIINHLTQSLPPTLSAYQSLTTLQQSLQIAQQQAGFDTNYQLAYELCEIQPAYRLGGLFQHQQLIASRTVALMTLLESLISISPSSLQQTAQAGSAMTNLAWLGFGGAGSTFMQATFRELSASHHQQTHNMKVRALLTDNIAMNNPNAAKSGANGSGGDDLDQIHVVTAPTLPTSLAMTFSTQNEQWHAQQINQQQFQFEAPLFRMAQLSFILLELEINTITTTKEIALLQQLIPTIQITTLNLFQALVLTAGKQLAAFTNSFTTQLIQLYQATTQQSRTIYLLGNHNILILQQQLIATFGLLLQQFSATLFTPNTLSQLIPLVLFDVTSYFHDLTRVQQQFRLIGATQKDVTSVTALTKAKAPKDTAPTKDEEGGGEYTNTHNLSGDKTAQSLNRVVTAMANTKAFTFRPNQQEKMGFTVSGQVKDHQEQQTILTTPSTQHIVPHSLQFPTMAQQQQHEFYVVELITLMTQLFQTTTSSILVPSDVFAATSRILTSILHSILTPYGTTLLPIPQPTLLALLKLLNALARFQPGVGSFSPLMGESLVYFNWAMQIPQFEIAQYAKQCLANYSSLLAPAMAPPSLTVETVNALNQLRDRAAASITATGSTIENKPDVKNQFNYHTTANNNNHGRHTNDMSAGTTATPLTVLDANNSFPLLLYSFQQGYSDSQPQQQPGELDHEQAQQSLDQLMVSLYHTRVRTIQVSQSNMDVTNHRQFQPDAQWDSNQNTTSTGDNNNNNNDEEDDIDQVQAPIMINSGMGDDDDDESSSHDNDGSDDDQQPAVINFQSNNSSSGNNNDNDQSPAASKESQTGLTFSTGDDDDDIDLDLDLDFAG